MIATKHRFHGHGSLRYVYQHGKTVRGPVLSLKYALNTRRQTYRLAVVVSKKINKSAVVRNRMRRRVYEVVRQLEAEIQQPFDLVITVFHEQLTLLTPAELTRMLRSQLYQARVIATKKPKPTPQKEQNS